MPLPIVASVAMTPILPFFVASIAARAPDLITPMIGMSASCSSTSSAYALAELQATTMAFTCCVFRKRTICLENLMIVSRDLLP